MNPETKPEIILEVDNLTKKFGDFTAVNDISFSINKGEIFAFLGPNGAGKTTTIKMLITLLEPTSGTGVISGHSFISDSGEVRRIIGYVPQLISADGTLTAHENLMLMARLYDIPKKERESRIKETLSFMKLEKFSDVLVRKFSGGMIRRLEIGQAILHHPKVLFLDEPTSGLDPVAKQNVWDHLVELRDKYGMTIYFTTHNMEEAEKFSDRIAVMNAGKIAVIGTATELKDKTGPGKTLEDAFIFFTGNALENVATGSFREINRMRKNDSKLG